MELLCLVLGCRPEGKLHCLVVAIGILGPFNQNGGVASHIEGLQREFVRRGFHVETVGEIGTQLLARLHPFQFVPQYLVALRRLRKMDLLHSHDVRLASLGKRLGIPLVSTIHGYLPGETRMRNGHSLAIELCEAFVLAAVETSDAIIAVDNRIARWLQRDYGAVGIHVIPNGVDPEIFHPSRGYEIAIKTEIHGGPRLKEVSGTIFVAREIGGNSQHPVILFAKGLSPKNGASIAVEAMPIVRRSFPHADLFMATGQVPHAQMPDLIRQADIVIVPSIPVAGVEEATSILALEAMASGKCVIASDIGGLREIIENDRTGILIPPGDPEVLAEEIVSALQDEERRHRLGRNAREYVVKNHSWAQVAEETMRVYESVLGAA